MSDIRITESTKPGIFEVTFPVSGRCSRGKRECWFTCVKGPAQAPHHGWDGNTEAPTFTPSIGCESRNCMSHVTITAGKITP